jgi:hypothetical protein
LIFITRGFGGVSARISSAVGSWLSWTGGLFASPGLKPIRELGEMVVCKGDCVGGFCVGSNTMSWGFGVPEMDVVGTVNEIGDSMDDLSLHFLYKKEAAQLPSIFMYSLLLVIIYVFISFIIV